MSDKYPLNSNWHTVHKASVLVIATYPMNNIVKGAITYNPSDKRPDEFGLWSTIDGRPMDGNAVDAGDLTQPDRVSDLYGPGASLNKAPFGTAHIDRGDGALGCSDLDAKYGRVSMRKIYADGAGMAEVESLLKGLGIQVIRVRVPGEVTLDPNKPGGMSVENGVDPDALASETLSALGWVFNGQAWEEPEPGELANMAGWPAPVEGYAVLQAALGAAYDQSARGKGKERHATAGTAFENQPLISINEMLGSVDGALYQVMKKTQESARLPVERARAELLGAMVYAAAAWHMLGEKQIQQNLDQF